MNSELSRFLNKFNKRVGHKGQGTSLPPSLPRRGGGWQARGVGATKGLVAPSAPILLRASFKDSEVTKAHRHNGIWLFITVIQQPRLTTHQPCHKTPAFEQNANFSVTIKDTAKSKQSERATCWVSGPLWSTLSLWHATKCLQRSVTLHTESFWKWSRTLQEIVWDIASIMVSHGLSCQPVGWKEEKMYLRCEGTAWCSSGTGKPAHLLLL